LSIITFILKTFLSFAQPTGDILKDTAQANRYFEEINATSDEFHRSERTLKISQEAVLLYEAHPFNSKLIRLKGNLSHILRIQEKNDEAKEVALSAIALGKENLSSYPVHPDLKQSYWTMSLTSKETTGAIKFGKLAMECTDKMSDYYFNISSELRRFYVLEKNFTALDSLLHHLEECIDEQENGELDKHNPIVYAGKIILYSNTGLHEQVIAYGQKFEEENNKYQTYTPDNLFEIYYYIPTAYQNIGNFEESFKWLDKCLKIAKETNATFYTCLIYGDMGNNYNILRKYKEAISSFEKAMELMPRNTQQDSLNISILYNNIGLAFLRLNKLDKAEKSLKKGILYYSKFSPHHHLLTFIYNKKGKYEAALEEIQKALIVELPAFKPKDINQNPLQSLIASSDLCRRYLFLKSVNLFELSQLEEDKQKLETSIEILKTILNVQEQKWQEVKGFEKSRYIFNKDLTIVMNRMLLHYYTLHKLMPSNEIHTQMFEMMEKKKAMQLVETISSSNLPDELYQQEKKIVEAVQKNTQQFDLATIIDNKDSITYYRNKVIEANTAMEGYLNYIKENYPKASNHFYNQNFANSETIQKSISPETLFIEYSTTNKYIYINSISHTSKKSFKLNYNKNRTNIKKLNELIQDRFAFQKPIREEFIDLSHELYKMLIEPIESELEGKTKIMIVLEGQLFHLPFELLLKSNEKKPYHELDFLIKKYAINYHYSATAFLKLQEKETVKDNSLLAFAPIFSKGNELNEATRSLDFMVDSLYRSIENFEFSALPSTKKEVKAIAKLVKANDGQANILLAKNATKTKLATELESQSYQFIHIATHGLVNFKNPKLSALACYSKNEKMDNLMYANEIQFKNINADLVVLSSCESGIGQLVAGEGLIALNRSFIYSGAKNVLFSLWKVSDKYSSELMIDFYKSYFKESSYTSALRQAKLKMLADPTSAQPKYWSAFVLMGQ
jgi:CHAT domain-containing protein/Tfp pilus assembly protein PilF